MTDLPPAIAGYFAAKNRQDIDAMLAAFAAGACVRDEGQAHHGHAAIRAWLDATTRKYRVSVAPQAVRHDQAQTIVDARVTGDFPGSPALLCYRFTLSPAGIAALDVG